MYTVKLKDKVVENADWHGSRAFSICVGGRFGGHNVEAPEQKHGVVYGTEKQHGFQETSKLPHSDGRMSPLK